MTYDTSLQHHILTHMVSNGISDTEGHQIRPGKAEGHQNLTFDAVRHFFPSGICNIFYMIIIDSNKNRPFKILCLTASASYCKPWLLMKLKVPLTFGKGISQAFSGVMSFDGYTKSGIYKSKYNLQHYQKRHKQITTKLISFAIIYIIKLDILYIQ